MIITDFLSRTIQFNSAPNRIVSLVPSQTELLVDLGLEEKIVGVTKFCVHPKHLRSSKTLVGGTKQVHLDKIERLNPDVILCNKEENTQEIVNSLEHVAPIHISDIKTLKDNNRLILDYGKIFNVEHKANQLVQQLIYETNGFKAFITTQPELKVGYLIWRNPWMAVGNDNFIQHMLEVNRFQNVFQHLKRYPEIDIHNLPELDLLLLSSEPYPFKTKHLDDIPLPKEKIKFVDGELFSWYGSRMLKSFEYFKSLR